VWPAWVTMVTPATCTLNDLAKIVKQGIWDEDLVGLIFHTIGVSDGMSNGTEGMRYSLVSRDIIADSIEAVTAHNIMMA
jgi:dihydroxy-acid dehydratase